MIEIETVKDFFERYTIDFTQTLDQKGAGSVYKAIDSHNEEVLVVKSIEMHPMFDKGQIRIRYQNTLELSHPNLLNYQGVYRFPYKNTIHNYVLMPELKLGDLSKNLSSLSFDYKIEILNQVLSGLAYLHENGQIWQNLRSDHLLLKEEVAVFQPIFINYGSKEVLALANFVNYEYLAPEQLLEQKEQIGPSTDIWAFGILSFELFTGQLPFGRKSPQSPNRRIQERILNDPIPDFLEQIPASYRTIIQKSLVKDPKDRWQTIEAIQQHLQKQPPVSSQVPISVGVLQTLEKMGEEEDHEALDSVEDNKKPFLARSFKRKPSRPLSLWEPLIWLGLAIVIGSILSRWLA